MSDNRLDPKVFLTNIFYFRSSRSLSRDVAKTKLFALRWLKIILINLILVLRPLFGMRCCRYTITCTQYAEHQLNSQPFWLALKNITKRVLSCQPVCANQFFKKRNVK